MKRRRAAASGVGVVVVWIGCAFAGTGEPAPENWRTHRIESAAINEPSGLVRSRRHPGVLWTHNDSGDRARFFAVDDEGRLLAEFAVPGARNVDWEDIAIDDAGFLYLGDIGNNRNDRDDLSIYRVREPDPANGNGAVTIDRRLRFAYADQEKLGDRRRMNFDGEAIFWRAGNLYVFTKHRSDSYTKLYRLDPDSEALQRPAPLARFDLGDSGDSFVGNTTGADLHPDGKRLALLTYRRVFLLRWPAGSDTPSAPEASFPIDVDVTQQAESVSWDGDDLLIGNEQRRLFRIPDPFPDSR